MNIRFEKKVALITGATSGIGRSTASRFADSGARLLLTVNFSSTARRLIL